MLYNAALVLEGGAFRGQYTAGIVDTFLAHHIEFRSVMGVSAGSLCGVNFVSKQYGRAANININHRHDRSLLQQIQDNLYIPCYITSLQQNWMASSGN